MRIRLELDEEATTKLVEQAVAERRPLAWEAEVPLRRALGLPVSEVRYPGKEAPACTA